MTRIGFFGAHRNKLGESPLWDEARQRLWWVDSLTGEIAAARADGEPLLRWRYDQPVGSIGLAGDGLVAALADGFYSIDGERGGASPIARVGSDGLRFNDGKADRAGRFLSGEMRTRDGGGGGRLWRLDQDGTATPLAEGFAVANALCFAPDGQTLYAADSLDGILRAYPYDPATGAIGPRHDLVDCRDYGSGPDGATVDADGNLWVALVLAQAIACFSPTGDLLRRIDLPIPYPSCPAFGGDGLAILYVTTIGDSGHRLVTDHPDGGRILAIEGLGARGLAEGSYRSDHHIRE